MSRPPRNVNFYDGLTGAHLGGVRQNGSITDANFFHMLMDVLLKVDGISIHHRGTGQPKGTTISFALKVLSD
ncbi:hypothetical protein N7497_008167 [Penicillium chrysogenum]|nr:hypothetical protein N7497_008167 [Penicillium chrysogenum]